MIHRHSPFYIRAVCSGKVFKTSNRNDVLLGQEDFVKNSQIDQSNILLNLGGSAQKSQLDPGTKEQADRKSVSQISLAMSQQLQDDPFPDNV